MANEASRIDNPDNTPGAVSSGYQAQNLILTALMNGMDNTVVEGGVGEITIKISGPIDVNGVLYSIAQETVLTIIGGAANYCIYLDGAGVTLTPTLTTTAGVFDPSKNAHYTAGGKRILNWMIQYDGTTARVFKVGRDNYEDKLVANGTWTAMFSKVYEIWVTGKGGDSSNADAAELTGGGGGGLTGKRRILIESGTIWTAVFSAIGGGNTTFSDGVTTLSAQNGYYGHATDYLFSKGGKGGYIHSGFDVVFIGGHGGGGYRSPAADLFSNPDGGGASFYGSQEREIDNPGYLLFSASPGNTYGAGATGAVGSGLGASGYSGIIRVIG